MKIIGYYMIDRGNFTFNPQDFYSFIHNIRNPLHILYRPDKKTPGLATGGEISWNDKKGIPLIGSLPAIYPEWLGDRSFLETHNVRFAYTGGAMARGIASSAMVIELARCGMMGFLGSGGMNIEEIEKEIIYISNILDREGLTWGVNLIHSPQNPSLEEKLVELYLNKIKLGRKMRDFKMGRKNYSSDLTDKEWEEIKIYFPDTLRADKRGRPREHSKRKLLNGIFYVVRSGCSWRMLPHDFPDWTIVYHYFRMWKKDGTLKKLMMRYEKKCEGKQIGIENRVLV